MTMILDPPAFTLQSVPGLNATHQWEGGAILNDIQNLDGSEKYPRARVRKISGWNALPERNLIIDPRIGQVGETGRFSMFEGKTVTYEGVIEALDDASRRMFIAKMGSTFSRADGQMLITPFGVGGTAWIFDAEVTAYDPPEEFPDVSRGRAATKGHERMFQVQFRLHDPRFYTSAEYADTVYAAIPATVYNLGTAPTDPILELQGPGQQATIQNDTLGTQLHVDAGVVPAGQFVRIDFAERSITLNGTDEIEGALDDSISTWWDPGKEGLQGVVPPAFTGANVIDMPGGGFPSVVVRRRYANFG